MEERCSDVDEACHCEALIEYLLSGKLHETSQWLKVSPRWIWKNSSKTAESGVSSNIKHTDGHGRIGVGSKAI